jgi:hypothetical protein
MSGYAQAVPSSMPRVRQQGMGSRELAQEIGVHWTVLTGLVGFSRI